MHRISWLGTCCGSPACSVVFHGVHMIRSFVARASALLASATFAFLVIAPVAVPPAQGRTLNFPDACSLADQGGGNFTMTCGGTPPGALNCSITGGPSGAVAPG